MGRTHDHYCRRCKNWWSPFDFASCPCDGAPMSASFYDLSAPGPPEDAPKPVSYARRLCLNSAKALIAEAHERDSNFCPKCGDPCEYVICHDSECPTSARCCNQGCSHCKRTGSA